MYEPFPWLNRLKSFVIGVMLLSLLLPLVWVFASLSERTHCVAAASMSFDLSACEFHATEVYRLDGEWAFFWNQFVGSDVTRATGRAERMVVPNQWNAAFPGGDGRSPYGFATYHTQVTIPPEQVGKPLALRISGARMASAFYIDGQMMNTSGTPGMNKGEEIAKNVPYSVPFTPRNEQVTIAVEISNFTFYNAGLYTSVYLGQAAAIEAMSERISNYDLMIITVMLTMAVFFFAKIVHADNYKVYLSFAAMCLLAALFMFTQGGRMIYDWFPNLTAATFVLIAYTTSTLVFTCIIHHLYYLMPDFVARKLLLWSRWLALFFFVTFVVLPVEYALYSAFLLLFHHSAILLYAMYVFVRSSRVRHPGSEYYLVACVAVILYFMQWVLNASFNVEIYRFPPIYVPIIVLSIGLALSEQQARLTKTLNASELARMRHQIKPHFIFNSLNTIIWMSKRDVAKTEQLLKNLSNYLRGSFDFDDREMMVPFYQEVDLTKAYLAIEQVRFAERLKVDWDIQTADFSLPPFILQPLVENAVHHGLQKVQSRDKGIRVQIRTTMTDSHYVLEVADDGAGFTQAQLVHWATENVEQFAIDGKGIGLKNIRIRLLKLYGTNLELARSEWGGALVTVRIPKKQ